MYLTKTQKQAPSMISDVVFRGPQNECELKHGTIYDLSRCLKLSDETKQNIK